jgi:hypothetical protein
MVQDHSTPAKVGYEADESARGEAELGGRGKRSLLERSEDEDA